jgi:hypothetical protein
MPAVFNDQFPSPRSKLIMKTDVLPANKFKTKFHFTVSFLTE